jgi:hypothetical protein
VVCLLYYGFEDGGFGYGYIIIVVIVFTLPLMLTSVNVLLVYASSSL